MDVLSPRSRCIVQAVKNVAASQQMDPNKTKYANGSLFFAALKSEAIMSPVQLRSRHCSRTVIITASVINSMVLEKVKALLEKGKKKKPQNKHMTAFITVQNSSGECVIACLYGLMPPSDIFFHYNDLLLCATPLSLSSMITSFLHSLTARPLLRPCLIFRSDVFQLLSDLTKLLSVYFVFLSIKPYHLPHLP